MGTIAAFEPRVPSHLGQRWQDRNPSWVSRRDGGFGPDDYLVELLDEAEARRYVETHHYSGSYPAARWAFGLRYLPDLDRDDGGLVGVAVFGIPVQAKVLSGPLPTLEPYRESIELSRLVLEGEDGGGRLARAADGRLAPGHRAPGNAESWMVARCFDELTARGIRGVVAFSDPVARRRADGTVVMPGHAGFVYQALNAVYAGRGAARTITVLPDGTTLNARAMQKVRRQEQGHAYVERRLVDAGAPPPPAGAADMSGWLAGALDAVGAHRLRHRGNHRYVWAIGGTRRARARLLAGVAAHPDPYPKAPDRAAA